jgi:hypothetical protein
MSLGIICGLLLWAGDQDQNLRTGRFLGTVWADSGVEKPGRIEDYYPSLAGKSEDNPGYALLLPDSAPPHPARLGKPSPKLRPLPRPKARKGKAPKKLARR